MQFYLQVLNERLDKEKENYATLQEASKKKLLDSNMQTKELINTLKQRMAVSFSEFHNLHYYFYDFESVKYHTGFTVTL